MPYHYTSPKQSFQLIRNYLEKWEWEDPATGITTRGFMAPVNAKKKRRVPAFVKFVTLKGEYREAFVTTLAVDPRRHQRKVKLEFDEQNQATEGKGLQKDEIRVINDYLIIEIDGVRFITH